MRSRTFLICLLVTILVSACDFWPQELDSLADSIAREVSGEATAWRVGGDVMVIDVANSPLYSGNPDKLEAAATRIAARAIAVSAEPLQSVSVTFHEGEVTEEADKMREFIFLVVQNQPVLQPRLGSKPTGLLTLAEAQALFIRKNDRLSEERERMDAKLMINGAVLYFESI